MSNLEDRQRRTSSTRRRRLALVAVPGLSAALALGVQNPAQSQPPPWTITVAVSSAGSGSVTSSPSPSYVVSGGPPACPATCTWGYGDETSPTTTTTIGQPGSPPQTSPNPAPVTPTPTSPTPTSPTPTSPTPTTPATTAPPATTPTIVVPPPPPGGGGGGGGGGGATSIRHARLDAAELPGPVTLTETPATGYQFVSWTVWSADAATADCTTAPTCTVTFDSDGGGSAQVIAEFVATSAVNTVSGTDPASLREAPSAVTSQLSSESSSLVIIIFFLLLGIALFARQIRNTRRPKADGRES